jgi:hypothetical protein
LLDRLLSLALRPLRGRLRPSFAGPLLARSLPRSRRSSSAGGTRRPRYVLRIARRIPPALIRPLTCPHRPASVIARALRLRLRCFSCGCPRLTTAALRLIRLL